jgi:hypothetical protein
VGLRVHNPACADNNSAVLHAVGAVCRVLCAAQDVKKAQSLGFAFDKGIEVVEGDVTKGARSVVGLSGHLGLSLWVAHG